MPTSFLKKSQDFCDRLVRELPGKLIDSLRRNPLVPVCIAAMAGITVGDRSQSAAVLIGTTLIGSTLSLVFLRNKPSLSIALATMIGFGGFGGLHLRELNSIHSFPLASILEENRSVEISGTGWIRSRAMEGERSLSAILEIRSVELEDISLPCRHRVPVWIEQPSTGLQYGDTIRFSGRLHPLEEAAAPGGFDPKTFYYRHSGSLGRLEIRPGDRLERLPESAGSSFIAFSQNLRDRLEGALATGLRESDEPYARLIAAMSLGARENSPGELEEAFRRSGTMHIFAVSGLHVGIVGGLFLAVFLCLRVPKRYAVFAVIPLILFYAILTGLRPSAVRAAIMLCTLLAAFALRERPRLVNSLAFAGLLILACHTRQLFLPGFQLSFAVLLCIALFAEPVRTFLAHPWLSDPFIPKTLLRPAQRWKDHTVKAVTALLAISAVSWAGSVGLLTWHFHSFSPVGILANLFLVPLAGVVVTLAVASLASHGLHLTWMSALFNQLNVGTAVLLTGLAQFFASLPGAHQHSGDPSIQPPENALLSLDLMGEHGEAACLLAWRPEPSVAPSHWLIDSGGSRTFRSQLLPTLRSRGINRIDGVILSHGDVGHIGAVPEVLSHFRPGILLQSGAENRSPVFPRILSLSSSLGIPVREVDAHQRIRLEGSPTGQDLTLTALAPLPRMAGRLADDRVLVLKLTVADWTLLFTSDAGFETEKALLASGIRLKSDVWIRGQHSETPSGLPGFVEAVDPKLVISSAAEFPSSEQISDSFREELEQRGAMLIPLDTNGVVTLTVDDRSITAFSHRGKRQIYHREKSGQPGAPAPK